MAATLPPPTGSVAGGFAEQAALGEADGRAGLDKNGMARETGLEPATSGVTGRRSNQLSYSPATRRRDGRTGDLPDRIGTGPSQAQREASPAAACRDASAANHRLS